MKFAQTAAALKGVPSENWTPLRSLNVHASWFLLVVHSVASDGTTVLEPFLKPTRLSKIWPVGRSDSPSDVSDGSKNAGSADAP